ncbi:hypothetical protein BGZ76_009776 [Entomortierella beljakovae]|nr:hypothetical protein BGZ76_009776 [Entomortierella beljakovae]
MGIPITFDKWGNEVVQEKFCTYSHCQCPDCSHKSLDSFSVHNYGWTVLNNAPDYRFRQVQSEMDGDPVCIEENDISSIIGDGSMTGTSLPQESLLPHRVPQIYNSLSPSQHTFLSTLSRRSANLLQSQSLTQTPMNQGSHVTPPQREIRIERQEYYNDSDLEYFGSSADQTVTVRS